MRTALHWKHNIFTKCKTGYRISLLTEFDVCLEDINPYEENWAYQRSNPVNIYIFKKK